jgi:hypothetical protein
MNQEQAFSFYNYLQNRGWERHSSGKYWYRFDADELPGNPWPPRDHNIAKEDELWKIFKQT